MGLIIKQGRIITASDDYIADIRIENGIIVDIAQSIQTVSTDSTIDAKDMYVFPGIIDAHVHMQLPMAGTCSSDDFTNGTKAAACGGVTTIIDFSTQMNGKSLTESIIHRQKEAEGRTCIDYSFHAGITDWKTAKAEIAEAFLMGISSFKMFMAYRDRGLMSEDDAILGALEETKKYEGIIAVHAESAVILEYLIQRYHTKCSEHGIWCHTLSRPDIVEISAIERAIHLAELSKGNLYIVHTSTGGGANAIRLGRQRGVNVYGETCTQYLLLDDAIFRGPNGHLYTSCPQIKSKQNQEQLWQHLCNNDFHVIATDHCPFTKAQKDMWGGDFTKLPFGMPGVETLLSTMYTFAVLYHKMPLQRLMALLTYNPAKIYGLYPHKGTIAVGSDGDLVVFDPKRHVTIHHKDLQTNCDWSPYEGMELTGYPEYTISRGQIIAQHGKFTGIVGHGKFIKRGPSQPV